MTLSVRQLKRQHCARWRAPARAWGSPDYDDSYWDYDEDEGCACTHCGGEGFREVDDPLWDDCDEFGYGPCSSCNGTGLRSRQTVF